MLIENINHNLIPIYFFLRTSWDALFVEEKSKISIIYAKKVRR